MNIMEMIVQATAEEPAPSAPEQQVAALREFFAARATKHAFAPGQIIRHKTPAIAHIKDAEAPHMFVEYLKMPIRGDDLMREPNDMSRASSTHVADCLIALHKDGIVVTFFSDSRMWEPHPDFTEAQMN